MRRMAGLPVLAGALAAAWLALGAPRGPAAGPSELAGLNPQAAVALANEWAARGEPVRSFITTEALNFEWPDGRRATVSLGRDQVYVAVAPYLSRTHPCAVHVLSGCRGELPNRRFRVRVSRPTGEAVWSGEVVTLPNGFFELWLPRGQDLVITVQGPEEAWTRAVGRISTHPGSPTCITDLRLR